LRIIDVTRRLFVPAQIKRTALANAARERAGALPRPGGGHSLDLLRSPVALLAVLRGRASRYDVPWHLYSKTEREQAFDARRLASKSFERYCFR
jgi:hypothetical protein